MKVNSFIAYIFLFPALASCTHEPVGIAEMDPVCFETEILPIFQTNCTMSNCHNSDAQKGGYSFEDYNHIMEAITPNDPRASKAYTFLSNSWLLMPPDNPLPASTRNKILIWIEQGAPNSTCTDSLSSK